MAKQTKQYAILANKSYGLYCGTVEKFDEATGVATVTGCRHIAHWRGRTGGITSLAAHGICGPDAGQSRIGAPCPSAVLTGIVNIFECTAAARSTLESAVQS